MGQKYAAYNAQGAITAFYDSFDSPVPAAVTNVLAITDVQWQAAIPGGYTVANGVLVAPVPVSPTAAQLLAAAQASQIAVLSAACAADIVSGFTSSALGAAHTYPSKTTDQQNLNASVVASLMPGLPANWTTPFWCADGAGNWAFVNHTAAQIQQAGQDGKAAILACMSKNAQLGAQVAAATTVTAVQAIVWS